MLVHDEDYSGLTSTAMLLYGILHTKLCDQYILESSSISISKGYDDIYITFSNAEIAQFLNISDSTVSNIKKELINYELLKIERKPYCLDKFYLKVL